ncbi:hypothetical protein ACOMHN_020327 [Nucella lapillus]
MPGLKPGGMNGHSDYGRFGPDRGYTNGSFDQYSRDDPYRDEMKGEEDIYRRPTRNGGARPPAASDRFNSDHLAADQNSLSDFNSSEPAFELDHLATFAAGDVRKGTMHVEDGLRKLRQMENTTGIWTMRCILLVERRFLLILDKNSGEELERFPIHMIQDPTAVFKNDRREIYNNLVLFTVMDDSNKKAAHADMHIFQSVRTPAQNIVDEIFASKGGRGRVSSAGYKIPPQPPGPASDPYNFGGFQETIGEQRRFTQQQSTQQQSTQQQRSSQYGASQFANGGGGFLGGAQRSSLMARPSYSPFREQREDDMGNNELLERDVQLLNHCFDDIEKFVARLQQAAEAYKELERRKRERGGKGKKPTGGDGMLGHRARPPPAQDFVDIFQKFKLSFNLLAKLKAHIHDPNAPELVHFLFTPLSLIYEASRDPIHGSVNLGEQAVAPVLTQDAKQLLLNCLTSKEIELWQGLGKNWTISKDEWKGYMPPYVPRFYDGWQPAPVLLAVEPAPAPASRATLENAVAAHHTQIMNRQQEQDVRDYVRDRMIPFPPEEERFPRDARAQDYQRFEPDLGASTPPRDALSNNSVIGYQQNYHANQRRVPEQPQPSHPIPQQPKQPPLDDNSAYLDELKKTGAKVYEVQHDRQGKNAKELTVNKGDFIQVLDSSRNWWKVRNFKGQSGYCPYTILKEVTADNARDQGGSESGAAPPQADRAGNKRGDMKYF